MSEPKKLTLEELASIPVQAILAHRELQRDLHLSIDHHPDKVRLAIKYADEHGKWKGTSWVDAIQLCGDPGRFYYFQVGWPIEWEAFLRPEDVIPSGKLTLRHGKEAYQQALERLKQEGATIPMIQADLTQFEKALDDEQFREELAKNTVAVPIETMEDLELAVYECDSRAIQAIGTEDIPFTKALHRANLRSGTVEQYNMRTQCWEEEQGIPSLDEQNSPLSNVASLLGLIFKKR